MTDKKKHIRKDNADSFMLILGVILLFVAGYFFFTGYETSQDGVVEGKLISVVSRVKGDIVNVYVEDNQEVKKGDLLLEIDPQVYQLKLKEAEAELNNAKVRLLMCERPDREEIVISDERRHTKSLIDSKYVFSRSDLDKFAKMFSGNVQKRKDKLNPIEKKKKPVPTLQNAQVPKSPEDVLPPVEDEEEEEDYALIDTVELREQIKALESKVADCKLNLSYTKVYATQDGIISSRNVQVGDSVEVGQDLVNLIPKHVWVVANYKSAQADKMHEGQVVYIRIEDYPRKFFKGMVLSVNDFETAAKMDGANDCLGSDSVPVKIVFTKDYSEYNIVPGMAVSTSVKVN